MKSVYKSLLAALLCSAGVAYSVVHYVYLHGRPSMAATVAVAAGHAAFLFAVPATVYFALRMRLNCISG